MAKFALPHGFSPIMVNFIASGNTEEQSSLASKIWYDRRDHLDLITTRGAWNAYH